MHKIRLSATSASKAAGIIGAVSVLLLAVLVFLDISLWDMVTALPAFLRFFGNNFLPPNLGSVPQYAPLILDTILFAVAGTCISAVLAFIFGLLISPKTNSIAWLRVLVRSFMSLLRNVPILVWAALLVYIFGIGNLVGLCALILATLGMLSRSYAESVNEIAGARIEALKASGATGPQILVHGIIPEFIPAWLSWTLFSFEINIRASAILGMVGAGGIGIMIQTNIRLFKYHEALSLILVLVVMVIGTEFITNKLRKRVR